MLPIAISDESLDPAIAISQVSSPSCGAIDVFIGTVHNQTKGKTVVRLEFESYEKMNCS